MANEIQCSFRTGQTVYALIRNSIGQIWNTSSLAFENYLTANYPTRYPVALTEQGSASAFYAGNFPASILPGTFGITVKQQIGGSAAESDPTIAVGNLEWNGSAIAPLSDTATSGQIGQIGPLRLARGVMIRNFSFYLKSAIDHVTPLTSGICSGQIMRDGGTFQALQSGAFTENGLGFYSVQSLTSGDLLCNTGGLLFNAVGVSGGNSDPCPFTFVTQKVSGQ